MKIGIYAGTFDPIHNGHIEFARCAISQAKLERVIILAEKDPYRKEPHAPWDHRQAMIERAAENVEKVDHDYQFANTLARQHTMQDMLTNARKHYGEESEIWFLVGSDVFEHMGEWKNVVNSSSYGGFVVALKEDCTVDWLEAKQMQLQAQGININIEIVLHEKSDVSSSEIRTGENIKNVDKSVLDYIKEHHLYR